MELVSVILKLATTIVSLAMAARRNKTECQELANRALEVTNILKNCKATSTTKGTLDALNDVLQEAHEIVESCCRVNLFAAFQADKFKNINERIGFWLNAFTAANVASLKNNMHQLLGKQTKISTANGAHGDVKKSSVTQRTINYANSTMINTANGARGDDKKTNNNSVNSLRVATPGYSSKWTSVYSDRFSVYSLGGTNSVNSANSSSGNSPDEINYGRSTKSSACLWNDVPSARPSVRSFGGTNSASARSSSVISLGTSSSANSTRENISSWNYDKSVPQNGMYSSSRSSSSSSNAYSSSRSSSSSKSTYYFSPSQSTYCPAFHATTYTRMGKPTL